MEEPNRNKGNTISTHTREKTRKRSIYNKNIGTVQTVNAGV